MLLGSSAGIGANSQLRVVRIKRDGDRVGDDDRLQGSRFFWRGQCLGQRFQWVHGDPLSIQVAEPRQPHPAGPISTLALARGIQVRPKLEAAAH